MQTKDINKLAGCMYTGMARLFCCGLVVAIYLFILSCGVLHASSSVTPRSFIEDFAWL